MSKIVLSKHTFNKGILDVQFELNEYFKEVNSSLEEDDYKIVRVDVYEYDNDDGSYVLIQDELKPPHITIQLDENDNHDNHLVRCDIWIKINKGNIGAPCCAKIETDDEGNRYIVVEEYFVDLHMYESSILQQIKLGCDNNCEVPLSLINSLLKLFTVQAAVDAHSPQMEMIFSKIACGKTIPMIKFSTSRNCNCNG